MGNLSSYATWSRAPLAPQRRPVVAVHASGCCVEPMAFEITHQIFPSRFVVRDAATGVVCYRKERKLLSTRQLLVDVTKSSKLPVVNAKRSALSTTFSVRPGALDAGVELFQIYAKVSDDRADLRVDFADLTTGEPCRVTLEGNWRKHEAVLWLERGGGGSTHGSENGDELEREPVAKVWPRTDEEDVAGREEYTLEVASNVDVVLMLVVCMVLDERWRRYKSHNDL